MIFVIADDNVLSVYDSEAELQGACEGIDVEDGVYKFFGPSGQPLNASFYEPNQKGKILGVLGWVVSGQYSLVPAKEGESPTLLQELQEVVGIDVNPHFKSLEEVRGFLTSHSSTPLRGRTR